MRAIHKFQHNLSDAEIRSIFLDAMRASGLIFEDKDIPIEMDGKTRYVRVANRSRNKVHHRSGWYIGHLGDFPAGKFGWMHGDQSEFSWSLYKHLKDNGESLTFVELTTEQIEQNRLKEEREKKKRIREEIERYNFSKALTLIEWHRALPLKNHPYLASKGFNIDECSDTARLYNRTDFTAKEVESILKDFFPEYVKPSNIRKIINYQVNEIRFRGLNIIIKGESIDNEPQMFQLIFNKKNKAGKNKHFPKDLVKHQSFCRMGPELNDDTKEILICEGWATAISLRRITCNQIPIFIGWDSGNMKAVAVAIRKKFKNCLIKCAIDNDHTKPDDKNAGIIGGLKICHAVGAYLIKPPFDPNDPQHESLSDWNDIDMHYRPQETTKLFYNEMDQAKFISATFIENNSLLSNNTYVDFNSKPDDLFLSPQFSMLWGAITPLIVNGLQHCEYSIEEQETMFSESELETSIMFIENGWDKVRRLYDTNLDIKASQRLFEFTNNLLLNQKPITASSDLFLPVLKDLQRMQDYITDTNTLQAVFEAVNSLHGMELAKACLPPYLIKMDYFRRTQQQWQKAVLIEISNRIENISLAIITPLILNSREADFWEYSSANEREIEAASRLIRVYEDYVHKNPLISNESIACLDQLQKLNHITQAVSKYLISPSEHNFDFLDRIINRFNETEHQPYPKSQNITFS